MIDFADVDMAALNQEHPEHALWSQSYLDYELIYKGGQDFKRAAGLNSLTIADRSGAAVGAFDLMSQYGRRRRFLYQLEGEPDTKYVSRWERCYYIPYAAAIIDYFRHWLFSSPPSIRPKIEVEEGGDLATATAPEVPDWYDAFMRNATGNGTSFHDLGKQTFGDVLIYRRAGWLIATSDMTQTDASPITLTAYDAKDILDWQEDASGKLEWIILTKRETRREFPNTRRQVEIRTYLDRDSWAAWEITRNPETNEDAPTLIAAGEHGLGEVPFEWITLPDGMWVMNKLAAWQIDLFNQMSMLAYSQLVSCFLQPFIKTTEGTESATNRILGEGIILSLRTANGDSGAEEYGWVSPNVAPLEFNAKRLIEQRDEGYRIVHQMALAVDSQAIGAIARSGASKIEDRRAAEIMLCGYGGYVRDFQIRTLNKISRLLGDNTEWVVDGYDNFQTSSLDEEVQTAVMAQSFQIDSATFSAELQKQIATGRILGHLDETLKAKIRLEIDAAAEQRAEAAAMGTEQIDPTMGDANPEGEVSPEDEKEKGKLNG